MIAATLAQFILLTIDDDSGNLLIHKYENCTQQRWDDSCNRCPGWIVFCEWWDEPIACGQGGFQFVGYLQFGCFDFHEIIKSRHTEDGNDNGEITNVLANNGGEESSRFEIFQNGRNDKRAQEQQHRHEEYI